MRRIVRTTVVNAIKLDLDSLKQEYKSFKENNPEKTARVPKDLKLKVLEATAAGVKLSELSSALGISVTSIRNWLASAEKMRTVASKQLQEMIPSSLQNHLPHSNSKSQSPDKELKSSKARTSSSSDWIKLRIDGKEIEVSKEDFWKLVR